MSLSRCGTEQVCTQVGVPGQLTIVNCLGVAYKELKYTELWAAINAAKTHAFIARISLALTIHHESKPSCKYLLHQQTVSFENPLLLHSGTDCTTRDSVKDLWSYRDSLVPSESTWKAYSSQRGHAVLRLQNNPYYQLGSTHYRLLFSVPYVTDHFSLPYT